MSLDKDEDGWFLPLDDIFVPTGVYSVGVADVRSTSTHNAIVIGFRGEAGNGDLHQEWLMLSADLVGRMIGEVMHVADRHGSAGFIQAVADRMRQDAHRREYKAATTVDRGEEPLLG